MPISSDIFKPSSTCASGIGGEVPQCLALHRNTACAVVVVWHLYCHP